MNTKDDDCLDVDTELRADVSCYLHSAELCCLHMDVFLFTHEGHSTSIGNYKTLHLQGSDRQLSFVTF